MGSRSSKSSPKSYDIAPVVSDKDFSYKRQPRPLPTVKLPEVIVSTEDDHEVKSNGVVETAKVENGQVPSETTNVGNTEQQVAQTTSAAVETSKEEPKDPRIPSWVKEDNFKPLLVKLHPNFAEIVSFKAYPALAPGENYVTLMLRVKITIKLQDSSTTDLSYMLKVAHDNKEMMEMLKFMNFFDVENTVYNEVIPEMEEMYRQVGLNMQFGPKAYQLAPEAPKSYYLLLEDLSLRSFKNVNRLECLDMEHTLAVLRKLAQFHAASICRVAAKGNYPATFSMDIDNDMSRGMMAQLFGSFKKPFMENLKSYENGELYEDAMNKFFDNLIDEFIYGRKIRPDFLNVLNHGDAWSNNILFNYTDDGKLNEVYFVDFQNTNYGPLAQDIFYFLISSARVDIKVAQYEYFIHYYHQHLEENMKLLKYPAEKIPSLRELHMQLIDYGGWATVTSFMTMGVVLLDPTNDAKFENFMGEENQSMDFKNSLYSNPRYRTYINEILPWLFNRGFMETHDHDKGIVVASTDKESVITPTIPTVSPKYSYPEWVNEAYFDDVIRADFHNYQKILKFDVSPATSAGDNYSSIMLKVDMDIELQDNSSRNISYMLKIPPTGQAAQAIITFLQSFVKEITAYKEIVPHFSKVFKEQAGLDVVFGPKSYKPTKDSGCETLILENLRLKGFKNADRLQGLDMDHTKAVLQKMAQFHAASAYLFETQGNFSNVYERSIYTEEYRTASEARMTEFYGIMLQCAQDYDGHEEYIDSLKKFLDHAMDYFNQAFTTDFSKFNVLNHGDCWTNNIMFQYNDQGEIANTYLVDFQMMKYGSPAHDLYYFLLTSTKLELKIECFDYFIRYYHENLQANLELLKYPKAIPTLKELHQELLEQGAFALYTSAGVMGAVLLDPTENANLEEMMKSDEGGMDFKRKMFSNQRYRAHAEAIFPWMLRRGLMEVNIELPETPTTKETPQQGNIPSWIDAEHFEDVLKADIENFHKITDMQTTAATKCGDNYASTLLRVTVNASLLDGSAVTKSYILKIPLESEQAKGMMSLWNFFEKEIALYSKYLPEFEAIYNQYNSKVIFGPKFFQINNDIGQEIILMEDLRQSGFKCGDRRAGLDMIHVKSVLAKLAQFHAVSAKYVEMNGTFPEILHKGIFTPESQPIFEHLRADFCGFFKQYDNNEEYIDKVSMLKYGHIGYHTSFGTTAICLLEENQNADLTNFVANTPEGNQFRNALFLNDKYKATAAIIFPWLARRGCLD